MLIVFYKLTLGLTINMDNLVCNVYFNIYLFGNIKKSILVYPRKKKKDKSKKTNEKKKSHKLDIKELKKSYPDILKIIKLLKKGFIIKEIKCYLKEGTGNAYYTAILYGLIWNLLALLQTVILNNFTVKKKEFNVETDFMEKVWKLNFNCIFSVKIVNIILVCKELLIYYLKNRKGGEADVRPSNRRFNDYSNAKY